MHDSVIIGDFAMKKNEIKYARIVFISNVFCIALMGFYGVMRQSTSKSSIQLLIVGLSIIEAIHFIQKHIVNYLNQGM